MPAESKPKSLQLEQGVAEIERSSSASVFESILDSRQVGAECSAAHVPF